MSESQKILKLSPGEGFQSGKAFVRPILRKQHGGPPFGVGVSEHAPGRVDIDLTYDEALYVLEGALEIVCGDERYPLSAGEFLYMPRGRQISYDVPEGCRYLYITCPASPGS